jgi:hypothetical protein
MESGGTVFVVVERWLRNQNPANAKTTKSAAMAIHLSQGGLPELVS